MLCFSPAVHLNRTTKHGVINNRASAPGLWVQTRRPEPPREQAVWRKPRLPRNTSGWIRSTADSILRSGDSWHEQIGKTERPLAVWRKPRLPRNTSGWIRSTADSILRSGDSWHEQIGKTERPLAVWRKPRLPRNTSGWIRSTADFILCSGDSWHEQIGKTERPLAVTAEAAAAPEHKRMDPQHGGFYSAFRRLLARTDWKNRASLRCCYRLRVQTARGGTAAGEPTFASRVAAPRA